MRYFKSIILPLILGLTMAVCPVEALAQVTTSSISGIVAAADGSILPGATVVAVHEPSGAQYATISNNSGRFLIQGLRPGGPYKVLVSFVGYKPCDMGLVSLVLGDTYDLDVCLAEEPVAHDPLEIVTLSWFSASRMGSAQRVVSYDMADMPTISGSIADMARLSPMLVSAQNGAMSFVGASSRYNSFQVDGAASSDVFGLSETGTFGGKSGAQPIPAEAIDQIQLQVAPFDIRQGGFTGGSINAVTKSGGSELHGTAYGYWRNQGLVGSYEFKDGKVSDNITDYMEYRAGLALGGPIVRDRLFFFAFGDRQSKVTQNNYGIGAQASKADAALASSLLDAMRSRYGYNGSFGSCDDYVESIKLGLKLDWNISRCHKASLSFRMLDASMLKSNSTASGLSASDYMYDQANRTSTVTAEAHSIWQSLSNDFQASYVHVYDAQDPKGEFPCVQVQNVGGASVNFGTEPSSAANSLRQDIISFTDDLTLLRGSHAITLGAHGELYRFDNLFIQNFYGTYTYNSPQDFMDGNIGGYKYQQANEQVTGSRRWSSDFWAGQLSLYAQDRWSVNSRLAITLGLRADVPAAFGAPDANSEFNSYARDNGLGLKTNQRLSSSPVWEPRAGFRWNIRGREARAIRGGVGVFLGRIPFVWYANNFANTGIQFSSYSASGADLQGLALIPSTDGQQANVESLKVSGSQTINVFDPDFQLAKSLRSSLSCDFELWGIDWTAEGVFSKTLRDICYKNLAYQADGGKTVASELGLAFDTRPMMRRATDGTPFTGIYLLGNTSQGYSYSLSLSGRKSLNLRQDGRIDLMAAYTYTQAKSVCSANSNVAASAYNYNYTCQNPNDPELARSASVVPHKIAASAIFRKSYCGERWRTAVAITYTGYSGSAYSIYYNGDLNGDGARANDLIFIPTDQQVDEMRFKPDSKYTPEQQAANMKAWLASDSYMSGHRGEYFERYGGSEDFESHFDLRISQQLRIKAGKSSHAIELSISIMNISNMLSKKWGRYSQWAGSYAYYSPVTYCGGGQFQFLHDSDYNMRSFHDEYSRWRGQIGIKYIF